MTWWSLPSGSRHEPHNGSGAPGTAHGLVCTSALLAVGVPPALASASVHATEVVTTGLSGGSHLRHRNVDWGLFRRLARAGVAGGALGPCMLVKLPGAAVGGASGQKTPIFKER